MKSPMNSKPLIPNGAAPAARLRIALVGSGGVGLVTAASLARLGHHVTAFDSDAGKVAALQRGDVPIHEPGLRALVTAQCAAGRLAFTAELAEALADAALVFVAVGTPARDDGSLSTDALDAATTLLCAHIGSPTVVVLTSTVPVGTARGMRAAFAAWNADIAHGAAVPQVVSNPEFLREGSALQDFMAPDRLIFGVDHGDDEADDTATGRTALTLLRRVYAPLIEAGAPVFEMDTRSAELAKCAANAMLAARISFVNEIAAIAEATGADIERVCEGIGSDRRIGPHCLKAGLGYGGSGFPKDVAALRHAARQHQLRSDVLAATERVNGRQRCWPLEALRRDLGGWPALRGLRVAMWGLAFKPGTDDMREAPSLLLIERLRRAGVHLQLHDPAAMANAQALVGRDTGIRWCASAADALDDADALMLVTEWPEFVAFAPEAAASALRLRSVFDGRNALDAAAWGAAGLRVFQVGRRGARRPPPLEPNHAAEPRTGHVGRGAATDAFSASMLMA